MATSKIKVFPNIVENGFSEISFGVFAVGEPSGKLFEIGLERREDGKRLLLQFTETKISLRSNRTGTWQVIWEK